MQKSYVKIAAGVLSAALLFSGMNMNSFAKEKTDLPSAGIDFILASNGTSVKNIKDETDAKKAEIVKQREQEVFDRVYQAYVDAADSELNTTLWQSVRVDADAQIATDGFFAVYEEYFNAN